MSHGTVLIIIVVVAILAIAFAAWMAYRKTRTDRLRRRFGPEYDRAIAEMGNRKRAEDALEARRKRVAKLTLRTLSHEEQERFAKQWTATQARFVDDPRGAVADANRLVKELMQARGYPMGDFEQRAADISVDHPRVVSNYREAREIAARSETGKASTEDMRKAFVCYRALFEELLETPQVVGVAS